MKLRFLHSFLITTVNTFKRFPLALMFTLIGASIALFLIRNEYNVDEQYQYLYNCIMSAYLGMLLSVAIPVYAEQQEWSIKRNMLFQGIGLLLIMIYYFSLPSNFMFISTLRFGLFALALHLLIAFVPFMVTNQINGFWQYNKNLFLRINLSALYSAVLFLGLALAIVAVDHLFKVHVDGKAYAYLWILIATIFNTWFFLSDFPTEYKLLEAKTDYPKGLQLFTQYVLLPLITVYLIILYSYMIRILVLMQLPVGWVSYLVLFFSVAGILSLLLIHPVRKDENNKWIPTFSRFFYFAIFPLIVLLFFAIKRRISDYGITEPRYFVLLIAFWLLFIAAYFLLSKTKNIKLIPITLCCIALLSTFGPWGAFSVSLRSQQNRLSQILTQNKMLKTGKAIKAEHAISVHDHREITSIVEYLVETHGFQNLQNYFASNLDSVMKTITILDRKSTYSKSLKILELLGVQYTSGYDTETESEFYDFSCEPNYSSKIKGYDLYISNFSFNGSNVYKEFMQDEHKYKIEYKAESDEIKISSASSSLNINIESVLSIAVDRTSPHNYEVPFSYMTKEASSTDFTVKLIVMRISGKREGTTYYLKSFSTTIFIKTITPETAKVKLD